MESILKSTTLFIVGAGVGFLAKELFFPLLFENLRFKRALNAVYRKYRDPLFLSASELANRLREICLEYPTNFLRSDLRGIQVERMAVNSSDDPYFRKYKFVSTVYRFCAFLGWLELYRQDLVFLDSGHTTQNALFTESLDKIRSVIADGHLNRACDWEKWADSLVFREELRAIGEAMIVMDDDKRRSVIGYRKFSDIYLNDCDSARRIWFELAENFLSDLPSSEAKNYRLVRLQFLFIHLVDMLEALDPQRVSSSLLDYRREFHDRGEFGIKSLSS